MKIQGAKILITGGGSGIGFALAQVLAADGASLALVGRNREKLERACSAIAAQGGRAAPLVFDLAQPTGHAQLIADAKQALGGLDILVNNAGVADFCEFSAQTPEAISAAVAANLAAPLLLTRAALPDMLRARRGQIVNMGSGFGSIGFPHFAVYSATKFGIRGFSEALRRELADSGIAVTYVAPRGTLTDLNSSAWMRVAKQTKIAMDTPEAVAAFIAQAIARDAKEAKFGAPEKIFAKLNGLLPRLLDQALAGQTRIARAVLQEKTTGT